jgi:Zn finger protein HypA/HybF involved in hydrogenase expression
MKIKLHELECKRCGHKWNPRKKEVIICPKCKSPYWNREKEHGKKNRPEGEKIQ